MMTGFFRKLDNMDAVLAEGSVIERLRRDHPGFLDPFVANAACVYNPAARETLRRIYRQYIDIGLAAGLPVMILTPTWRGNPERIENAGLSGRPVNLDCAVFLKNIRNEYPDFSRNIFIGGLMGCRGDAYNPKEALPPDEAYRFHKTQAGELAEAGVDFLMASTLPSLSEALGMVRAMALFGECIVSFVIRGNGELLDGTPLTEAVQEIDASVRVKPAGYMVNCVHPKIFREAIENLREGEAVLKKRLIGLQANTSEKSPEELDGSPALITEDPGAFAVMVDDVRRSCGLKIVGGCCGTDNRHLEKLAYLIAREGKSAQRFGKEPY